jgi:hypothetical protein
MKYWANECDTWASRELEYVAKEQYAQNIIGDYEFEQDEWRQVSANEGMWLCEIGEALHERKKGKLFWLVARIRWFRPLWWVFLFHRSYSKLGRAWFMCSTEC